MDNRTMTAAGMFPSDMFDCRRYIKKGDLITYQRDTKDLEAYSGIGEAIAVYEQFVFVKGNKTNFCVNRWNIKQINHVRIVNGFMGRLQTLKQRGCES